MWNEHFQRFQLGERFLFRHEIETLYGTNQLHKQQIIGVPTVIKGVIIFTPFKLDDLIHLYGAEYPFRREKLIERRDNVEEEISDFSSSDDEHDARGDASIASKEELAPKEIPTSSQNEVNPNSDDLENLSKAEKQAAKLQRVPLLQLNLSESVIHKDLQKLVELEKSIDLEKFANTESYFSVFLRAVTAPEKCDFCYTRLTNPDPISLLRHIVSKEHLENAPKLGYNTHDLGWWCGVLRQAMKIQEKKNEDEVKNNGNAYLKEVSKAAAHFGRIPLLHRNLNDAIIKSKKLTKLEELATTIDYEKIGKPESFISMFLNALGRLPEKCDFCEEFRFEDPDAKSVVQHILSNQHINNVMMLGYNCEDVCWICIALRRKNIDNAQGESEVIPIPLLQPSTCSFMEESGRQFGLNMLDILLRSVDKARLNHPNSTASKSLIKMFITKESCQFGCETPLRSTDAYSIITHCLTSPHREKLIEKGFSRADIQFWSANLDNNFQKKPKVASTSSKAPIAPAINKVEEKILIPLLDFSQSDCSKEEQEGYLNELKVLWNIVDATTWKQRGKKVWQRNPMATCAACNLPPNSFSDAVALGTHIFSSKHLQHLENIGFAKNDYMFWKTCMTDSLGAGKKKTRIRTLRKKEDEDVPTVTEPPVPELVPIVVPEEQQQNNEPVPVIQAETESALNLFPKLPFFSLPVDGTMEPETFAKQFADLKSRMAQVNSKYLCADVEKRLRCEICDRSLKLTKLRMFKDHLVSKEHCKNIMKYRFSQSDFDHWEKLLADAIELQNEEEEEIISELREEVRMRTDRVKAEIQRLQDIERFSNSEKTTGNIPEFQGNHIEMKNEDPGEQILNSEEKQLEENKIHHGFDESQKVREVALVEERSQTPDIIGAQVGSLKIGDSCIWGNEKCVIKFIGQLEDHNELYAGVEFENPGIGAGTGIFKEKQIFVAKDGHAGFVDITSLEPIRVDNPGKEISNFLESTLGGYCTLPLFVQRSVEGAETDGPSVSLIEFVQNIRTKRSNYQLKQKPCLYCRSSFDSTEDMIEHAFSINHLKKLKECGIRFYMEDFIDLVKQFYKLKIMNHMIRFTVENELQFPMFKRIALYFLGQRVFAYSHCYEELLGNFDNEKFDKQSSIYTTVERKGCHLCNIWLPTPSSVVKHALSKEHFAALKLAVFPITTGQLDYWGSQLRKFQKSTL